MVKTDTTSYDRNRTQYHTITPDEINYRKVNIDEGLQGHDFIEI